jgi:hypothetical protein
MLKQRPDHRRLCRQLHHLHFAVAMAEALSCRADGDECMQIQVVAHVRQHLEWQVEKWGRQTGHRATGAVGRAAHSAPSGI